MNQPDPGGAESEPASDARASVCAVLVTYHPAYLLPHRSPEKKREVWEDMKVLLARMGRPIPTK